jgi:hypothetical protein
MNLCAGCQVVRLVERARELRNRRDHAREHGDLVRAELLERALVRLLRLRIACPDCGRKHVSWLAWLAEEAPNGT